VIVGILGGLYGALFNKLNLLYCNFRKRLYYLALDGKSFYRRFLENQTYSFSGFSHEIDLNVKNNIFNQK